MTTRADCWDQRYRTGSGAVVEAVEVVRDFLHLLPNRGAALDVACGRGGNALALAGHGLDVQAWDISTVAVQELREQARSVGLSVTAEVRDAVAAPPQPCSFDVITVSRFLHRPLCATLSSALRSGGLLFYQTFTRRRAHRVGPGNPDYLLADNELLELFPDLLVRYYRDEACTGNIALGFRNEAQFIGERQ